MKIPAAFFPASAETLPIAKYIDEYSKEYYITTLLTIAGFGILEKDAGYADNRPCVGKIMYSSIQETKDIWKTLLVANHSDRYGKGYIYNLTVSTIKTAMNLNKIVICAAQLKPDDLQEIMSLNDPNGSQFIYLPDQENLQITLNKGRLYCPIAPILFVGGLIDEANTLEAFLSVSGELQRKKINIISLSANINCSLAGITTFTQLTSPMSINEVQKVYAFNHMVEKIEEYKHPDLFIVHLSGAIMEYNDIVPNGFGLFPYIISKALTPDFFICCIPCEYAHNEFISAINEGIVSRYGFRIDYVHISNAIIDGGMILNDEAISVVYTTQEDVNSRVAQLRSSSEIPAFNLLNNIDLNMLCEDINKQLKEDQGATVIL